MEKGGWVFDPAWKQDSADVIFKPGPISGGSTGDGIDDGCNEGKYGGWRHGEGKGLVSLTLKGSGTGTIEFGVGAKNHDYGPNSVDLLLNGRIIDTQINH